MAAFLFSENVREFVSDYFQIVGLIEADHLHGHRTL
jgi:hypothetical protein